MLQTIHLNDEIRKVRKMIEPLFPKMIEIRLDTADDLPMIRADQAQIGQILTNLCINARDVMPDGGTITIRTEHAVIGESSRDKHPAGMKKGQWVVLTVSDTGCGMDPKTCERAFDPFFTTKEVGQGSGLGLSVVYGIVESHDGVILCESTPGKGTGFSIYFPGAHAVETTQAPPNRTLAPGKGAGTILIVDDEKAIIDMTSQMLTRSGYDILAADCGESALEIYMEKKHEIDLVLLDLGMPGMGGRACLRNLIKFDPDAKVVIASGYSNEGLVKDALNDGARAYVLKPFSKTEIFNVIQRVVS